MIPSGGALAWALTYPIPCSRAEPGPTLTTSVWVMRSPVFCSRMPFARANTRVTSSVAGARDALSSTATLNRASSPPPGVGLVEGPLDGLVGAAPPQPAIMAATITTQIADKT